MTINLWFAMACAVGFGSAAMACGGSDEDGGRTATGGSGGGTGTGGSGATGGSGGGGGATGGSTGTGGSGSGTVAGSCSMADMGLCITYECAEASVCQDLQDGGPTGCELAGGTWATSSCSLADSIGSCRESDPSGDVITTFYPAGGLTTALVQQICSDGGGTFTNP